MITQEENVRRTLARHATKPDSLRGLLIDMAKTIDILCRQFGASFENDPPFSPDNPMGSIDEELRK